MKSVELPGVTLDLKTFVVAGWGRCQTLPVGQCILAGNPANMLQNLNESQNTP